MATAALIALIESLVPVIQNIIDWINKAKASAAQSAEWTPEQEAAVDAAIAKLDLNPEVWQKSQPL